MRPNLSSWSIIALLFVGYIQHQIGLINAFGPVPCRLHSDIAVVYATSIFFKFHEPIQDVDTIELQCSRLRNGRGFDSFNALENPAQDVSNRNVNAFGLTQIVISGLMRGTLYHCRCLSISNTHSWSYESRTLSLATLSAMKDPPTMQPGTKLSFEKSDVDTTVKLKWIPLAQDILNITIQVDNIENDIVNITFYDFIKN